MLEIYSKCHNSPTNRPTGTQIGWSHPIMSPTCPPWCGCHGNGRYLATTREPILMKFGIQQQIRTTMTVTCSNIKIFKIQNGGRPPCWKKYPKYHNSPTNGPTGTQLGWSHPIMCPICPPWCGCYGNGRCVATAQHSAVMGVWRPNAWTNCDEIWYATAS